MLILESKGVKMVKPEIHIKNFKAVVFEVANGYQITVIDKNGHAFRNGLLEFLSKNEFDIINLQLRRHYPEMLQYNKIEFRVVRGTFCPAEILLIFVKDKLHS